MNNDMRLHDKKERKSAMLLAERLHTRHFDINQEPLLINSIMARNELLSELRQFFAKKDIIEHAVPHMVAKTGACESYNRIFNFDYYGKKAFLVQSCQLHQECFLPHFGTVFSVNESFRKEHFFGHNHLSESTLFESLSKNVTLEEELEFIEKMLSTVAKSIIKRASKAFTYFGFGNLKLLTQGFERVTYKDALKICGKSKGDFSSADTEKIVKKFGRPVFVMFYPDEMKFFTTKRKGKLTLSADLMMEGSGEVMGITETESDPKILEKQFDRSPLAEARSQYEWYFDLHRKYNFFQSGLGMGIERLLKFICGLPSVTLAVPFARYNHHLNP